MNENALLQSLKSAIKSKGFTYQQLATELNVSSQTVKRIFLENDCNLSRIFRICEIIGISFQELQIFEKDPSEISHVPELEMSKYFAENPDIMTFYFQLGVGAKIRDIVAEYQLSEKKTHFYIKTLEDLGYIERIKNDQVKVLKGLMRNPGITPITQLYAKHFPKFMERALEHYKRNEPAVAYYTEYVCKKETYETFSKEVSLAITRFMKQAIAEKNSMPLKKLMRFGVMCAISPNWINDFFSPKN